MSHYKHSGSGGGGSTAMIIGIVTIVVLIGGVIILSSSGGSGSAESNGPTKLTAVETFYDFGTISMKNGKVDHLFKVMNPTKQDIVVSKVHTSCMCTSAFVESPTGEKGPFGMEGMGYVPPADETIKAGESRNIKVEYDPNAHGPSGVGDIDRFVYLEDATGGKLQFEIKAVVTP